MLLLPCCFLFKGKERKGKGKKSKETKGKETKRHDGLMKSTLWTWNEMSWLAGIRSEVNRVRQI